MSGYTEKKGSFKAKGHKPGPTSQSWRDMIKNALSTMKTKVVNLFHTVWNGAATFAFLVWSSIASVLHRDSIIGAFSLSLAVATIGAVYNLMTGVGVTVAAVAAASDTVTIGAGLLIMSALVVLAWRTLTWAYWTGHEFFIKTVQEG